MTTRSSSRLRFSTPRWRLHVQVGKLHGSLPLADIEQIDNADVEDSSEVMEHLQGRVALSLLHLLKVPIRDPLARDIELRPALPPAGSLEIPAEPGKHRAEVHGTNVVRSRTRIEPTGVARLWLSNFDPGRTLVVASA